MLFTVIFWVYVTNQDSEDLMLVTVIQMYINGMDVIVILGIHPKLIQNLDLMNSVKNVLKKLSYFYIECHYDFSAMCSFSKYLVKWEIC